MSNFKKIIDDKVFNCLVRGRYGYVLYNKNDTYVGKSFENYGEFSESEAQLFRQICANGDIIFDIGANIGAHTLLFSQIAGPQGRVYAFEPQRVVFQTLCANMALNSIENTECYQMGVGANKTTVLVPDIRYDLEANHGGFQIKEYEKGIKTQIVTIDDFFSAPSLKLIKVDVEGMEADVVKGAINVINTYKPFLYVENDKSKYSKKLIETIQSLDYRLFWHFPPLYNPDNYAENNENIFGSTVSMNMLCFHKSINLNLEGFQEITDSNDHPLLSPVRAF